MLSYMIANHFISYLPGGQGAQDKADYVEDI